MRHQRALGGLERGPVLDDGVASVELLHPHVGHPDGANTRLFLLSVLCILCKYEKYTFIVGSGRQVAVSVCVDFNSSMVQNNSTRNWRLQNIFCRYIVLYPPSLVLHLGRGVLAGDGVDGQARGGARGSPDYVVDIVDIIDILDIILCRYI